MRLPIVFLACLAMSKGFTLVSRLVTPSIQFNHTSSAKKDLNTFNMFNMFNHILQPFWLYSKEIYFLRGNNFYHFRHHSCCSFYFPFLPEKCYIDLQGRATDHNWALLWVILPWVQARCLHHFANHRCHHHFQGHHHHHHLHHHHNHQEGLCNHGVVVMMQSQSLSPDWSQLHHQQSCHFVKTFALRKSLPSSSSSLLTEPLSLACCILPLRNWRTLESWR